MSYPRIISRVMNSLWAIDRQYMETIFSILHTRQTGEGVPGFGRFEAEGGAAPQAAVGVSKFDPEGRPETEERRVQAGGTAVVFASGIVGKHLTLLEEVSTGGLNLDRLDAALDRVAADPSVNNVIVHLDTPGGVIHGVPETAARIRRLAEKKTVVGYVDSMAASAGYWILSGVEYLYATPSADVGSIGVYSAMLDYTGWMEKKGLKMELFKAGEYKAAGMPGIPLTDKQRERIQASVDGAMEMFASDVRTGRPEIAGESMEGQVFRGREAKDAGLADDVVTSLEEVLEDLRRIG